MGKPSYAFRLPLAAIEPAHDPAWRRASAATKRLLLRSARDIGLEEKRADIAAGLDAQGNPLAPLKPRTIKYRRSAMGPPDKHAPPLIPAHVLSRTSSLLDAQAHDDHVLFFWRFDAHTEGPWGRILHYHRIGAGHLPVRDVFGLSAACIARIKVKVGRWWDARKTGRALVAGWLKAAPEMRIAAPIAAVKPIEVLGRTDIEHYTFGIGGSKSDVEQAIAAGTFTGFRKPGTIKPRPWSDSLPKPPRPQPPTSPAPQRLGPQPPAPRPTSFAPQPPAPQPPPAPSMPALRPRPSQPPPTPPEAPPREFTTQAEADAWGLPLYTEWGAATAVNEAMRGIRKMTGGTTSKIEAIAAALARTPPLPEPIVVWRGIKNATQSQIDLGSIKVGDVWRDRGFTSTSLLRQVAERFTKGGGEKVLLRIELAAGDRGAYLRADGLERHREAEFLRPPDEYVVVGVAKSGTIPLLTIRPIREKGTGDASQ